MFKFFRETRKKLADDNKFIKYSRYAIGEILLVVIGILIALQINNWSENQKRRDFAKKLLADIKISLVNNQEILDFVVNYNKDGIASAQLLKKHLNSDLPYHDSLNIHFSKAIQYSTPILRNAGYESLKNYGPNYLQNDSLTNTLDDVYNMGWIETLVFRQENYFFYTASPILTDLFETVAMRTEMKPFDYEVLKDSRKYRSILNTSIVYKQDSNKEYRKWQQFIKGLIEMIEKELESP